MDQESNQEMLPGPVVLVVDRSKNTTQMKDVMLAALHSGPCRIRRGPASSCRQTIAYIPGGRHGGEEQRMMLWGSPTSTTKLLLALVLVTGTD